jgi:hypothetical protein
LANMKRLALSQGWEISDLTRALIVLAASVTWLALKKRESIDTLREIALLGRMRQTIGSTISGSVETKPPYPVVRGGQETDVITLILPLGVAELLESFASAKLVSKNDLCRGLLRKGLILYMTAQNRLLRVLQDQRTGLGASAAVP